MVTSCWSRQPIGLQVYVAWSWFVQEVQQLHGNRLYQVRGHLWADISSCRNFHTEPARLDFCPAVCQRTGCTEVRGWACPQVSVSAGQPIGTLGPGSLRPGSDEARLVVSAAGCKSLAGRSGGPDQGREIRGKRRVSRTHTERTRTRTRT